MNEETLDQLQRAAFGYFRQAVNPANGLIADTSRENSPSSIGVVGFALSAYPVAVERGWMARADAGSALVVDGIVEPMELGHLPHKKGTYEDYVGVAGLERRGKKKWRKHVADVVAYLIAALQPDDAVLGGGNVSELKELPPGCRAGDNANEGEAPMQKRRTTLRALVEEGLAHVVADKPAHAPRPRRAVFPGQPGLTSPHQPDDLPRLLQELRHSGRAS